MHSWGPAGGPDGLKKKKGQWNMRTNEKHTQGFETRLESLFSLGPNKVLRCWQPKKVSTQSIEKMYQKKKGEKKTYLGPNHPSLFIVIVKELGIAKFISNSESRDLVFVMLKRTQNNFKTATTMSQTSRRSYLGLDFASSLRSRLSVDPHFTS